MSASFGYVAQALFALLIALVMLCGNLDGNTGVRYMLGFRKMMQRCAPEALSLTTCILLAAALRLYGSTYGSADDETWNGIVKQWPILMTADTLLAIQAYLRLLVLASTVLRSGRGSTLISQETALISMGAAAARVLILTRTKDYMIEGPVAMGGFLPAACEVVSTFLLAILCRSAHRRAFIASVLTFSAAGWIAFRNRLHLSGDPLSDGLWMFAHTTEMLAAFTYLSRALISDLGCSRGNVALNFAHVLMPLQQCLAVYFFFEAFDLPGLTVKGCPFEILQKGGMAQVGAYMAAAVLHMAECIDSSSEEGSQETTVPDNNFRTQEPVGYADMPRPVAVPSFL